MGSASWYFNRLKSMSAQEITWRVSALMRGIVEVGRVEFNKLPQPDYRTALSASSFVPDFHLCDAKIGCWKNGNNEEIKWRDSLLEQANEIKKGKLSFFDLKNADYGSPINWLLDYSANRISKLDHCLKVDYRDFEKVGDCKLVWEPNRHHHLVVLARAWKATGDTQYVEAIEEQLLSWFEQNPVGRGMNWKSPLELGVRLINWAWVYDLCHESGVFSEQLKKAWMDSAYYHLRDVSKKFSEGSSANNHLVGEAAGVFIGAAYFNLFEECDEWMARSQKILEREIYAQSYDDGCTREHALGYQFFVIQFYLFSAIVAEKINKPFSQRYKDRLASLIEFVAYMAEGGEQLPLFGDCDDGYVLDLGDNQHSVSAVIAWANYFFPQRQWPVQASRLHESSFWLFGQQTPPILSGDAPLQSRAFTDSGYYLLQGGSKTAKNRASVLVDCADLGYQSIAAHGHADALSCCFRLNGKDVLIDPGTYDYFSHPRWRTYFRKTCAHNTVEIDGQDQSVIQGPFLWGQHAQTSCKEWVVDESLTRFVGSHDGYMRLDDPVSHERSIVLVSDKNILTVTDKLSASADHKIKLYFHLSEYCRVVKQDDNKLTIAIDDNQLTMLFDPRFTITIFNGDEKSQLGWVSRGYHQKTPTNTVVASCEIAGSTEWCTEVRWS